MASTQIIQVSPDGSVAIPSEWLVARITEVGSTQLGSGSCVGYPHAWIEQKVCSNGYDYEDNQETGENGTLTIQPAFAIDGSKASINDIVLVRTRGISPGGDAVYEFFKGGGGASGDCPRVSGVTCTAGMLVTTYQLNCDDVEDPGQVCTSGGPIGSIVLWSKSTIPTGWLECNGTTFNSTTYPDLFTVLGGNTLPDLKGRFVLSRNDPSLPLNTTGSITGGSGSPTLNNIALIYIIKAAN